MKRILPLINAMATRLVIWKRQAKNKGKMLQLINLESAVNQTIEKIMTASNSPKSTLRLVEIHTESDTPRGTFMACWNTTTVVKIAAKNTQENRVFVYSAEALEILGVEQIPIKESWIEILHKINKDEVLSEFLKPNPIGSYVNFVPVLRAVN